MESYSLYELNEYIKRVIALNFPETVWIHAEIAQIKESRGQVYLELVEKTENTEEIRAQSQAVIWYKSLLFIKNKLGKLANDILQEGIVIKAKAAVSFHERYGLKLVLEDIDPSYTLGILEMQRQEIIEKLKKEDLFDRNKLLALPKVIQRIAIVSSAQAAGLQDFYNQLQHNSYGYKFSTQLFPASVQGKNLESEVTNALVNINSQADTHDVLVIIRGGGSKIDLSGFDSYPVGKAIALSKIPVITGIGHEIDQNIADLLAHTSLKTPTAVANWIIDHNLDFESEMIELMNQIQQAAQRMTKEQKLILARYEQSIRIIPQSILSEKQNEMIYLSKMLRFGLKKYVQDVYTSLHNTAELIKLAHPDNTVERGFAMIKKDTQIITSISQLAKNDNLTIKLRDGSFDSTVDNIKI